MLVNNTMHPHIVDAILSAWGPEDECLSYSQVKQYIASKGLIKITNDRSLSRWLRNLVNKGILRKTQEGYFLEMKPKAYQVFDYLSELRQKYSKYIYEGEVGSWISHICALTYLNFDETLLKDYDEKLAFDTISTRIGELFWSLYALRNDIIKRRCGLGQLKLNDNVVREVLFGLLTRSIGERHATEEVVRKYLCHFGRIEEELFDNLWKKNKPTEGVDFVDLLGQDFFFDKIEEDPKSYKKFLKTESFNLDKYSIEELIDKYAKINEWIEQNHKPETPQKEYGYAFTEEEAEQEHKYRTAILTKVAEGIRALDTSMEDFGIIITRHPATMNQYFTPEHILYESVQWASSPPQDDLLRGIWQETFNEEKTFEGMVAERLSNYNSINQENLESLRAKPWVKKELPKRGSFDEILRLYNKKRARHLREDEKAFRRFFGDVDKPKKNNKAR